jgi:putative transposase
MPRSFFQIWIHAVWSTKHREAILTKAIRLPLFHHILAYTQNKDIHLRKINGTEDHVHALFSLKTTQTTAEVVKHIKGESSRWLNEQNRTEGVFKWQEGYGAFSVSPTSVQKVINYIENQESHHSRISYSEEILNLNNLTFKK